MELITYLLNFQDIVDDMDSDDEKIIFKTYRCPECGMILKYDEKCYRCNS